MNFSIFKTQKYRFLICTARNISYAIRETWNPIIIFSLIWFSKNYLHKNLKTSKWASFTTIMCYLISTLVDWKRGNKSSQFSKDSSLQIIMIKNGGKGRRNVQASRKGKFENKVIFPFEILLLRFFSFIWHLTSIRVPTVLQFHFELFGIKASE